MATLVTGGAGYIGAHVVRMLGAREDVVVVDDLSTGQPGRVAHRVPLVRLDLAAADAAERLAAVMAEHGVDRVVHLAGRKRVDESVRRPLWYYDQNVGGLAHLLTAMQRVGVRDLVLSSSAAVYGEAADGGVPVTEDALCRPLSPYGASKLVAEWLCRDAERAWGLSWVALRYFNVAGAGWTDLGDPTPANLVTLAVDAVLRGERPRVLGTDWDTPDGTCVRDYVHVADLARAHLVALDRLADAHAPALAAHERVLNVGTGRGSSVREVLTALGTATGRPVHADDAPRRAGDAAAVTADVARIRAVLGWQAQQDLDDIVASAWVAALAAGLAGRSAAG